MINYKLEAIKDSPHYNLVIYKEVNKRDGTIGLDVKSRFYAMTFNNALLRVAHLITQDNFEDTNISLKEYLSSFYRNWKVIYNENC